MSLATYLDLKTAIPNWLARYNLAAAGADVARVPEFISLAEARINRTLSRLGGMEVETTVALTGLIDFVATPADFLYARRIYLAGASTSAHMLTYKTPEALLREFPSTAVGLPTAFSVIGTGDGLTVTPPRLVFRRIPDAAYTAYVLYGRKVPTLVGGADGATNWMLTANPDVYLYAALIEAATYDQDDAAAQRFATLFANAMSDVKEADEALRWTGSTLTVRPSMPLINGA